MSVERTSTGAWRVRWREAGRNRSKVCGTLRDARAFEAETVRRKRIGGLDLIDTGTVTLSAFAQEWWIKVAIPTLRPKTRRVYAGLWDKWVDPVLGGYRLRDLTPEHVEELRATLAAAGLAPASQRKVLAILQGVLQRAVEWRRIPSNPARLVRKPTARAKRKVVPLPPATVEAIRGHFLADGRLRDATITSVLAYSGLRPGEMRALTWGHIRERTIHVEQAVSSDEVGPTKTGHERTVRLLSPLASDLAEWRLASGVPAADEFVFPSVARDRGRRGSVWTDRGWNAWQREQFTPAAEAVGVPGGVPYDLRHSFVSLLIQEGRSVLAVAREAGHHPTMCLGRYAHQFEEFDEAERVPAEDVILAARAARQVPATYPRAAGEE